MPGAGSLAYNEVSGALSRAASDTPPQRKAQDMAQFVSYYPDVIVQGAWMLALLGVLGEPAGMLAARAGLLGIQPDQWYPQQPFLDALREVCALAPAGLYDAGQRLGDRLTFPPEVHTVAAALLALEDRYQFHHRNDDRSHWRVTVEGRRALTCVSSTPYPSDVEYGIVGALVRRYHPAGLHCRVVHDLSEPTRKAGADSCTYRVRWGAQAAHEAKAQAGRTVVGG